MRRYFLAHARRKGYETFDLQPRFIARYRTHRRRFEWRSGAAARRAGNG